MISVVTKKIINNDFAKQTNILSNHSNLKEESPLILNLNKSWTNRKGCLFLRTKDKNPKQNEMHYFVIEFYSGMLNIPFFKIPVS